MSTATNDTTPQTIESAVQHLRYGLDLLGELERQYPAEVSRITAAIVAHVRSWKPDVIGALGDA